MTATNERPMEPELLPRVLVIVVGEDAVVTDDDGVLAEELRQIQLQLMDVPRAACLIEIGADPDRLAELLPKVDREHEVQGSNAGRSGFEVVHIIARATSGLLDLDTLMRPEEFASLLAGTSCRLVVISGEGGDLFVGSLMEAVDRLERASNHAPRIHVVGFPASRTSSEQRVAFTRSVYAILSSEYERIDPHFVTQLFARANESMGVVANPPREGGFADDAVADPYKSVHLKPMARWLDLEKPDLGFDESVFVSWRPRWWAQAATFDRAPQLPAKQFSFVSWVRLDEDSHREMWADTRGWNRETANSSWPIGAEAVGWAVGIYGGRAILQLNSGDIPTYGNGERGWYGRNYHENGPRLNDGKFHCVVQNVSLTEHEPQWFVDGNLIEGNRPMAKLAGVDYTGSELLIGVGKDGMTSGGWSVSPMFGGDLLLFAIVPRMLEAYEAADLTRQMRETLASDPTINPTA